MGGAQSNIPVAVDPFFQQSRQIVHVERVDCLPDQFPLARVVGRIAHLGTLHLA
jgi:hypothetical protein